MTYPMDQAEFRVLIDSMVYRIGLTLTQIDGNIQIV
jgi:hypothetical protein